MDILTQLVDCVETDLNTILHATMPDVSFKIWVDVGKHRKGGRRAGNKAPYEIEGIVSVTTSAMEPNDLVIGVNGATIEFKVPIDPPRTSANQTTQDLQAIENGQYKFVSAIGGILTDYFQSYKTFEFEDNDKTSYTVGVQGGASISGTVDISPVYGKSIPVSVYLEINIVENGIVSTDVSVYIDNVKIPKQALYPSRMSELNSDVLSGALDSTKLATSSALAFKINFPLTKSGVPSSALIRYLLRGEPNTAHFVDIYGLESAPLHYFMLVSTANAAIEGVSMIGGSMDLVPVTRYCDLVSVSKSYQVGVFKINRSVSVGTIVFREENNAEFKAFVCGDVRLFNKDGDIRPSPDDLVDNGDDYLVYMITDRAVEITPIDGRVTFHIVKRAVPNG